MSVAHFVAPQRTDHGIPTRYLRLRVTSCSTSASAWPTPRQQRRHDLDAAVRQSFDASEGPTARRGARRSAWSGVAGGEEDPWRRRWPARDWWLAGGDRRRWLDPSGQGGATIPDLVRRDFTASAVNRKWCGDLTEVPTGEGKLYLATVEDLASRRIIGFRLSEHQLATAAIKMAAAEYGGDVAGAVFRRDRGSEYNAELFATACAKSRITQSMGRAGSSGDNAAAEPFFSTAGVGLFRITPVRPRSTPPVERSPGSSPGTTGSAGTAPAR